MGLLVACGTNATPEWEKPTKGVQETSVAELPDKVTEVPATFTPVPPTATATELPPTPTLTVEPPTATPTEEAIANDPLVLQVQIGGSATRGDDIFHNIAIPACSTCHNVDVPDAIVGPSLLGIASRAGSTVEGEGAERYIYNSITDPGAHVVEGFVDGVMPPNYHEVLQESQILDLIAYLLTLE
ncbi:hypothetical protein MASR2M15_24880 [Anaerolineales bacterium]